MPIHEGVLLTFGLFNNHLKHISLVENGLACNCLCSHCKQPLVAKNNPTNIKAAHFAHLSDKECEGAIETTLHLLAKEILVKTKQIRLPAFHYDYDPKNNDSLYWKSTLVEFEKIIIQNSIDISGKKIIPDVIGFVNQKQIFIEFANTHFVNEEKKITIKSGGVACIEIDLREQKLDEKKLIDFFESDTLSKYWISNPRLDKEYLEFRKKYQIIKQNKWEHNRKIRFNR